MDKIRDSDPSSVDDSGVDREQIRVLLSMTMRERLRSHDAALRSIWRLERRFRVSRSAVPEASRAPTSLPDESA